MAMSNRRYPIRIGSRSAPLLRLGFGVTPERAWASLVGGALSVRFGWYRFRVPLENIAGYRLEGPWRWLTAIGVRHTLGRGDISFAGSPRGGVRLDLRSPVRWTVLDIDVVYVGVDDLDGFAAELRSIGIEGEDARRR